MARRAQQSCRRLGPISCSTTMISSWHRLSRILYTTEHHSAWAEPAAFAALRSNMEGRALGRLEELMFLARRASPLCLKGGGDSAVPSFPLSHFPLPPSKQRMSKAQHFRARRRITSPFDTALFPPCCVARRSDSYGYLPFPKQVRNKLSRLAWRKNSSPEMRNLFFSGPLAFQE